MYAPSCGAAPGCPLEGDLQYQESIPERVKMGKIKKILGAFLHAPERFDELAGRIAKTDSSLGKRVDELNIDWFMEQLLGNRELLEKLNRQLSITPTVWGDPARLEIDETADVFTCFFNTNSGRIRIGQYTFAGSDVSLLAGSHDPKLTGYLRRDAELSEGCDITIGNGVWLASGCIVLGPCEIGDNAVIAAGAVVAPGTVVPAGAVYAGIPAKETGRLDPADGAGAEAPAVLSALERNGGILFTTGWTSKSTGILSHPARFLKGEGVALTRLSQATVEYRMKDTEKAEILISGPGGEQRLVLSGTEGKTETGLPVLTDEVTEIRFRLLTPGAEVLLSVY